MRIIEDETSILVAAAAAAADEKLAEAAQSKTFGELRSAAHRLVTKLDPEAVRRRKEKARGEAHVRRFREASGNAGMTAREMPSAEILASMQHVEQRALDLRDAGVPGTLEELKVRAYLDLLQERDSRPAPAPGPDPDAHGCAVGPRPWPPGPRPAAGPGPPLHLKPQELLDTLKIKLNMVIRGPCNHAQAQPRCRPGRQLQHLVKTCNATCTARGCGRPATRCDLDHTDP